MKIKNISKSFGEEEILKDISMDIEEGEITVILGQSGCGKSTLLNILSGEIRDYSGSIEFERENKGGIGYIFQENSLIPWKNIYKNIEYVLKNKVNKNERYSYILKYLKVVNLEDKLLSYPNSLSGGMKRRVNIARAFAFPSNYLFMDEPFEFLDLKTKREIIEDLKKFQALEKKTIIFVTHDIYSAVELGDKIVILGSKPTTIRAEIKCDIKKEELIEKIGKFFL